MSEEIRPIVDAARKLSFALSGAEAALSLAPPPALPLAGRIEQVLAEAMARPALVEPDAYAALFQLREAMRLRAET